MSDMTVKIKSLDPSAKIPTYGTEGSAAFDFYPTHEEISKNGKVITYSTGLAFEIPPGFAMFIYSRSGHGFKNQMRLSNCVGVIDSDYRGEVKVQMILDIDLFVPGLDKAIAQAVIMPVPRVGFMVADELSDTARGTNGFGSTSK